MGGETMHAPNIDSDNMAFAQARLEQFITWTMLALAILGVLTAVSFVMLPDRRTALACLTILGYSALLLWARRTVRRGGVERASLTISLTILCSGLIGALITPEMLPTLAATPLAAVALALPFLKPATLQRLILTAWACGGVIAVAAALSPPRELPAFTPLLVACGVILSLTLTLVLLWHHHTRMTLLLAESRQSSVELLRAKTSEAQQAAEQRRRLLHIGQTLLGAREIEGVLVEVRRLLGQVLDYHMFTTYWLDEGDGVLRISPLASEGADVLRVDTFAIPVGTGIVGTVAASRRGELLNSAHLDPRSVYPDEPPPCEHIICLPIAAENGISGVFIINRLADPPFSEAEYANLQLFIGYVSLALQNARRFEQLVASESRYRALFESMQDAAYLSAPDGRLLDINPTFVELFGYDSREALLATTADELYLNPLDRQRFQQLIEQHGQVRDLEVLARRRDGQLRVVVESAAALRGAGGAIVAYRGFLQDITERKLAEERLELVLTGVKCLLWYAIVEMQDGAAGRRLRWKTQVFNEQASRQFLPLALAPGQSFTEAWIQSRPPEDSERADTLSRNSILGGRPGYTQEYRCRTADGTIRWLHEDVRVERIAPGSWRAVGVCTDVTERRRAEETLREAHDQLTLWVRQLERNTHEIELLNLMGELLQACRNIGDACGVMAQTMELLFPRSTGAIYMLDPTSTELVMTTAWGDPAPGAASFAPADCWALRRGRAHSLHDVSLGLTCRHAGPVGSLCVPMLVQSEPIGVLHLRTAPQPSPADAEEDEEALFERQRRLGVTVAEHGALAIANLQLRETLRHQAIRDPLTGLYNRRYMEESLDRELHRASRQGVPLGIIMLDLDYFKRFNDTNGHPAGDALLRALGAFLQRHVRVDDIACRYGGEEFTLILPESSLEDTLRRAEELRLGARQIVVQYRSTALAGVTLSLGVAAYPNHGASTEELLHQADLALYAAKKAGRDRVATAIT
ncbi:MAG: hypothetical protein RLZZ387_5160 [Chloroflexota bacterium]